jgi:hypothetical protein
MTASAPRPPAVGAVALRDCERTGNRSTIRSTPSSTSSLRISSRAASLSAARRQRIWRDVVMMAVL